jgi:hypothetical protein
MKQLRNTPSRILFALLFVSACAAGVARADVRDYRVISARAGGVNFVSGDVSVRRAGAQEWRALPASGELKGGDAVRTGAGGRVEILLNPGSYLRAGAGTEFTLAEADLEDLRVELARGGAVVEATGYSDLDLSITVATPRTRVRILRSGVYRIDVGPDGAAEVAVFKGRALVGETLVKGGKLARVAGAAGGVEVSKLEKERRDPLDLWSRERGKELARANEKLTRSSLASAFGQGGFDNLFGAHRRSHGFWFWNDRSMCYTFVPFYENWRSPYGHWYGTGVMIYPPRRGTWSGPGFPPTVTRGGTTQNPPGGDPGPGGPAHGSPAPRTPLPRMEPSERPRRERTIEPGHQP